MNTIVKRVFKEMKGGLYVEAYNHTDLYVLEKDYKWEGVYITFDGNVLEKYRAVKNCCVFNNIDDSTNGLYKPLWLVLQDSNQSSIIHHMSLTGMNPYIPLYEFYEQERRMNQTNLYSWKKRILTLEVESKFVDDKLKTYLLEWSMVPVNVENGMQSFIHKIYEILL